MSGLQQVFHLTLHLSRFCDRGLLLRRRGLPASPVHDNEENQYQQRQDAVDGDGDDRPGRQGGAHRGQTRGIPGTAQGHSGGERGGPPSRLDSSLLWLSATGPPDTQDSIQRHGSSAGLFKEPAAPPQRQATAIRPAIWAIIYNRYDSASLQRHTAVVSEKGTCGLLTASGWVEAPTLRLLPIHTECKSISTVLLMKTPRQRPQQRLPRVCNPLLVFASLFFSGGAEV